METRQSEWPVGRRHPHYDLNRRDYFDEYDPRYANRRGDDGRSRTSTERSFKRRSAANWLLPLGLGIIVGITIATAARRRPRCQWEDGCRESSLSQSAYCGRHECRSESCHLSRPVRRDGEPEGSYCYDHASRARRNDTREYDEEDYIPQEYRRSTAEPVRSYTYSARETSYRDTDRSVTRGRSDSSVSGGYTRVPRSRNISRYGESEIEIIDLESQAGPYEPGEHARYR